jgi:hypothetical protein
LHCAGQDPDKILDIKYAAVATGWGSDGDWIVCVPERCNGFFAAENALLSHSGAGGNGYNGGPIICQGKDTTRPGKSVDHGACDKHVGYQGTGYVDFQNPVGDSVTFSLNGCAAGKVSLNFNYASGNSPARPLGLVVNGVTQKAPLMFPPTGGWDKGNWKMASTTVTLTPGRNTISLMTTGADGPNLDFLEVEDQGNNGKFSHPSGRVAITADNGYILFVNGKKVGEGGAALPKTAKGYDKDGWKHTDTWNFYDSCDTPTAFAIEAVDSEGVAAVMAEIEHCGNTIHTSDQWKCSPVSAVGLGADRSFKVIDKKMSWTQANTYCRTHYAGLASIHSLGDEKRARDACAKAVTVDELPIGSCSASSVSSKAFACEHAYDNDGHKNRGEWATKAECGGFIQMNFKQTYTVGKMMFQQRWAEIDWAVAGTLQFSDGSTQAIKFIQSPTIQTYTLKPVKTAWVKLTFTAVKYPRGSTPPKGYKTPTCNTGAKEIQFFESSGGYRPHGCWIGLNDAFKEKRLSWTDGSLVDFTFWAKGEPNNVDTNGNRPGRGSGEDYVEMDFRLLGGCNGPYTPNQHNNCEGLDFRNGQWNDNQNGGDGGNSFEFPLCQTASFKNEIDISPLGCFKDSEKRDMDGISNKAHGNQEGAFFDMGRFASPQKCAQLCAGFRFMGLQYGSQCFCDNANAMSQGVASAGECNMPCKGNPKTMCGGTWRNSIYALSTNYMEMPGFDDSKWAAASDMGVNGVSPWFHRKGISDKAHWIWSSEPNMHDHVFCRFVQPNTEMNCPAAQAKYLDDYADVRKRGWPAWGHFQKEGKQRGYRWHEELCNVCTPAQMLSNCTYPQPGNPYSKIECNDNLCTNKCVGMHDAAMAAVKGAKVAKDHSEHYGLGFVDFINRKGDTVTFTLDQCSAGRHLLEFTYSLRSDRPARPVDVMINGGSGGSGAISHFTLNFPATGSWEEWGTVRHRADLLSGKNTIVLTATVNSGPNLDSLEVYPHGHRNIGHWRGNFDNSGTLYVNNQKIGGPAGTGWSTTSTFTFTESCDTATVYAMHVKDGERDEQGKHNVGGIIGSITHCGEIIPTNAAWRCIAVDAKNGQVPPANWNDVNFDDSNWQKAHEYGTAQGHKNHWNQYTEKQHPPYHVPKDKVNPKAKWIWTSEIDTDDDVYCRYVNRHEYKNCNQAANRYLRDYPEVRKAKMAAFDHFDRRGKFEGKMWHSELCSAKCEVETVPFDWVDATHGGIQPTKEMMNRGGKSGTAAGLDDSFFEVQLPFAFPFYGQQKRRALISTNGYLTFSGDHTQYGNTIHIPDGHAPNDMIAPYWTDLDMSKGGKIWTKSFKKNHLGGVDGGACQYGIANGGACCDSQCGTCGGKGCEALPGGEAKCCTHAITGQKLNNGQKLKVPTCRHTNGQGPCRIDEDFFVIQWDSMPNFCDPKDAKLAPCSAATSTFQVVLFNSGAIKFQYHLRDISIMIGNLD